MDGNVLELRNITKSFFGIKALNDVNFELKKGCVLGLIGQNGAGKSTLMNIIGGVIQPDAGSMKLYDKPYCPEGPIDAIKNGIAFIHQELNLFTNLSIAENIFINEFPKLSFLPLIDKRLIRKKTKQLLESVNLDVSPDTIVERLSPGERQLVEIAKALSTNANIIIFDEPTTSLTSRETEKLFGLIKKLRAEGHSIIYISHILEDIKELADDIVILRDGEVVCKGCNANLTINNMISFMVGRDMDQMYPEKKSNPRQDVVLELENVSQKGIVANISLKLRKGEILGIFGLMGSGRTELARIIFGLDEFEEGTIRVNGKTIDKMKPEEAIKNKIAFVTENRREEGLLMSSTIADNISLVSLDKFSKYIFKFIDSKYMHECIKQIGDALKIKCHSYLASQAKSLSGGNQQKVVIGKWLMLEPQIFIVDEPTRGIDVGAKYEVYSILNELAFQGSSILVISSEVEELIGICDRILVMSRGEITGEFARHQFDKEQIIRAAFRQNVETAV